MQLKKTSMKTLQIFLTSAYYIQSLLIAVEGQCLKSYVFTNNKNFLWFENDGVSLESNETKLTLDDFSENQVKLLSRNPETKFVFISCRLLNFVELD